jgi:hypothetical protein
MYIVGLGRTDEPPFNTGLWPFFKKCIKGSLYLDSKIRIFNPTDLYFRVTKVTVLTLFFEA